MNKKEAIEQLEVIVTNMTGELAGCKEDYADVIVKRIDAIYMGIAALKGASDEEVETPHYKISEIARQYMEHESQTFDMSRINSSTTLVQMYPELQSSEIVQKQIDIYYENNKKIKSLKNKEYKAKKAKFILYFGGGK